MSRDPRIDAIADCLDSYVIAGDPAELDQALEQLRRDPPVLSDLLDALDVLRGDAARKARALIAVRRAYGLSVIPGPVCRPRPLR